MKLYQNQNMRQPLSLAVMAMLIWGCTENIPAALRFQQQEELFASTEQVNTKIDLLWVVDNSASMDVSQQKLREGFASFANQYLKPTWDIQIAVITTDVYMANDAFSEYRDTIIPGSKDWTSAHISGLGGSFNHPWNPNIMVDPGTCDDGGASGTGIFPCGVKYSELVPLWSADYAKLEAGIHDGPITGLCIEKLPYFYAGVTDCAQKDSGASGVSSCLNPGGGESSVDQCVNTVMNNTVRSGKAILSTIPEGGASNEDWIEQLIEDFTVNATTGSVGHGSERGLSSVIQFLSDNESSATNFFREGSLRGIIFLSDEDDQSLEIPTPAPGGYHPTTEYSGTCDPKTVDSHTYTLSTCPDSSKLQSVSSIKDQIDSFFQTLDSLDDGDTIDSYFVVSIVPTTGASIQALQDARDAQDDLLGRAYTIAADRGDRYIDLAETVDNGSLVMDISQSDYTPILDAIGEAILEKKGRFHLNFPATQKDEMFVAIVHNESSITLVEESQYEIDGDYIQITDLDLVLSLKDTDQVLINYQPASLE